MFNPTYDAPCAPGNEDTSPVFATPNQDALLTPGMYDAIDPTTHTRKKRHEPHSDTRCNRSYIHSTEH